MSKVVTEWAPKKINPSPSQPKPIQSSSSIKDIPNPSLGGSFKTNQSSSQPKNVAFNEKTPALSSNTSVQSKQRSGIFYDISAGRGNFDDGYHSDYTHSLKQSCSVGNLDLNSSNNNTHKQPPNNQFHSSSSVNSFSHAESNNYPSYNQNQKRPKSGQRNNNSNRINRSGSYAPRNNNDRNSAERYKPPTASNSKTNSNNNFNNNNNRGFNNRPNNHNQDNYQPKQQTQPPTNS